MRRLELLQIPFYKQKFKNIYQLLFKADLDYINDCSYWHIKNPNIVEKNQPLWIIVESKIIDKRIWITKKCGKLEITTARLDLDIDSREYHESYERKQFKNQNEMNSYLEQLLEPCIKGYEQELKEWEMEDERE